MSLRQNLTIRFFLTCLVVACVLPVWLMAALLVRHAYDAKLEQVNRELLENARAMTMVLDRELASVQAALLALATSPSFKEKDFAALHRQSLELLAAYPGADIIVADATAQQLVNSYRPYGSKLPKRNTTYLVNAIFDSGKPVISNLFFGAVTKRPLIGVDVPVFSDGKVAYDLSMTFSSDKLSSVLQRQNLFKDWYCTVVDRNGVIVARTRNLERYVGRPAPAELLQAMRRVKEGTVSVTGADGAPVLSAFCNSAHSGWAVAFGVPKATVMKQIYQWMGWAIGGATAISLLGILLAMGIARAIARDIQSLVEPALAIGRGEQVEKIGIGSVKETAAVAEALLQGSELLQQRARERDRAERQLSLALDNLRNETAERIRAMEELRRQEQMLVLQGRQAALGEMIGNIAHQWRQPLNALGLLIQQAPLFYDLGEVNKEFLEQNAGKSMEIVKYMSRTIDDFRNFFKPDKEKVSFALREEVEKSLSLMQGSLQAQQASVEVEADGDPVVQGYPNEFSQALLNILMNARDAFAERKVAGARIRISIGSSGGRSFVRIADNAGGIPEEIIDKIFDPYFTTKGPQVGTGVGLFMSKTIIEKNMGGLLTARNADGGAEFTVEV